MAWLAIDRNGRESVFDQKPERYGDVWVLSQRGGHIRNSFVELPIGSIRKLIGKQITWSDEPIEIMKVR